MKSLFGKLVAAVLGALVLVAPAAAYDPVLAEAYAQMFAPVQGAKAGKYLHLIKPQQFVDRVRAGEQLVTLDIRTPGETRFLTGNLPGHLTIPLSELFKPENLAQLPTDKPIVVLCKSGARAVAAATALRQIGFTETYVVKGGFKGLIGYLGVPEANKPLGPKTSAR